MTKLLKYQSKSPEMRKFVKAAAPFKKGCATCGKPTGNHDNFRDDLSRKEYSISGMCQECQNSVFDGPEL